MTDTPIPPRDFLAHAYRVCCQTIALHVHYEQRASEIPYVHATARGHEAVQVALGRLLQPQDYLATYYRDDALLLSLGFEPEALMAQLLGKAADPFSGGRHYYGHPSLRGGQRLPHLLFQSSATGMQAISATGAAQGLQHLQAIGRLPFPLPIAACSLGDGAMTAGEVSEALHMAELLQAPIAFVVQDNGFSISAKRHDIWRDGVAARMAGYPGIALFHADGRDFEDCYRQTAACLALVREERRPAMLIAQVPLLGHHTSGIRSGYYRDPEELRQAREQDPFLRLEALLLSQGLASEQLAQWREEGRKAVEDAFARAKALPEPLPQRQEAAVFAPTPVLEERGSRTPEGRKPSFMVDAGRAAIDELLEAHPEAVYMGQDVGHLGGIFREAYGLQRKYGPARVRSMPIQEAYTIVAAAGLSAVGCRPIVSVPFADYLWAGLNQLRNELSPAYFLSQGKWPAGAVIRVPVGAYGGGGPYHSASIESALLQIKGLKVAYPSNGADLKGLLKAAFHDGNPVAILEHKGLYWAKTPLTKASMRPEPEADYVLPLGKACVAVEADAAWVEQGKSVVAIAYGMGVHWAAEAAKRLGGRAAVVDLRSLHPLDEALLEEQVRRHGKALVITEEPVSHSFAEALAGKLMRRCFEALDAPIEVLGALNLPAIPLNMALEADMLPSADKVELALRGLLEA